MNGRKSLKERLNHGEVVFGPWCVIPSGAVMNVIASAGCDFVIIDHEHGPASFETVEEMTRAAQSEDVSAVVRLSGISEGPILKSLDVGAEGVIAAHVETGEDAREVVALCKYHPVGRRGFSPYTRAGGYGGGDITAHARKQNDRTCVGVILEGRRGIENIDAVLQTEHLDLVYIGAYDLSQELGLPGDVGHPSIRKHMEVCVRRIRDAGIAAGGFVAGNRDDMAWMVDIGMQFVTYLPDCAVLHNALRGAVEDFRRLVK
jgi:4-hydroxy-2-oxoheptanedioate aldolase